MKTLIPQIKNRNVALYYLHSALHSLWFIEGIWYFYWGEFADFQSIALIFSVLNFIWILTEIPSGTFADKYGRKTAIVLGNALLAVGGFAIIATNHLWFMILGALLGTIGRAFVSGSFEALVYDDLLSKKQENDYDKVTSFQVQISIFAYAIGPIVGGFLFATYFKAPHLLEALAMTLALVMSSALTEVKHKTEIEVQGNPNLAGFKQLAQTGFRPFLIPVVIGLVLFYLYDWGMSKPAMGVNAGLSPQGLSIVISVISVVIAVVAGLIPKIRRLASDKFLLVMANIFISLGFIIGGMPWGIITLSSLFMIDIAAIVHTPVTNILVNKHVASRYRATSLSTIQFISRIPFLFLNFFAGMAIDRNFINQFHVGLGLGVLILTVFIFAPKLIAQHREDRRVPAL